MTRLLICLAITFSASASFAQKPELEWHAAHDLTVEGQGWAENLKSPFDRLPAKAEGTVRGAVWALSRHSAGICVRFVTDATTIHAKWSLTSARLDMVHMAATGVSGVDLYARTDDGKWRWVTIGRPTKQQNSVKLASGLPKGPREFMLYLPLYNGVTSLSVGVPKGSKIEKGPDRAATHAKPIVFYGTSITHGACASRTGMVHTAILGRWFDRPVINLGFSGNGRMESEVGKLIEEIDAAVYVIDCLPNITAKDVTARTAKLVRSLRKARTNAPIVLVEDRNYADSVFFKSKATRNAASQAALKAEYEKLVGEGIKNLHYIPAINMLGGDGEGTVDSSHPTDLGFMRQAKAFEKVLKPLLPAAK